MGDVLVIAETRDGAATPLTLELLAFARMLVETDPHPTRPLRSLPSEGEGTKPSFPLRGKVGMGVVCLLTSDQPDIAADLVAHGADRIYVCPVQSDEARLAVVDKLARELEPAVVLVAHTPFGADLAPRLAFRLRSGIATGCVGIEVSGDRIVCTRPCYGGNARETVSFATGRVVVTVRSGVGVAHPDDTRAGEIVKLDAPSAPTRVRVIARERETAAGTRLEDAKIVVAGGRGLEGPEGFAVLEDLAQVLGAAVGSSRVPCDLGWVPHSQQIGLTGKTVTPDLYFAVGISGAGHHMAGCGNARTIVAINTDPDAAIFKEAKLGIVGDYRKVVPALTEAIRQMKP